MNAEIFWSKVKLLIKDKNTTQEGIAKSCNISFNTFASWIKNNRLPDVVSAYKIAQALGTTVEYLITGTYNTTETTPYIDNIKDLLNQIISKMNELQKIIVQQSADQ